MACPEDDPSIGDAEDLWRRVHPDQVVRDQNLGRVRPSSAAFRHFELSCLLAREDTPDRALPAKADNGVSWRDNGFSLAAFAASLARRLRPTVCREPTLERTHPICWSWGRRKAAASPAPSLRRPTGSVNHPRQGRSPQRPNKPFPYRYPRNRNPRLPLEGCGRVHAHESRLRPALVVRVGGPRVGRQRVLFELGERDLDCLLEL